MTLKEKALALAVSVRALPTSTLIKLLIILVKPSVGYWAQQVTERQEAMSKHPKGSDLYEQEEKAYSVAIDNWHRANFTLLNLERSESFKSLSLNRRPEIEKAK